MDQIRGNPEAGRRAAYGANLASYFGTVPHGPLMDQVKQRTPDHRVLKLIKMRLQCAQVEGDEHGQPRMAEPKPGTLQGGGISPPLVNACLHQMDGAFHEDRDGPHQVASARLARYADDVVILAHRVGPRIAQWVESTL